MKDSYKKLTLAPFCYSTHSVGEKAKATIILLLPQFIMLFVTKCYSSILLIFLATIASLAADCAEAFSKKRPVKPASTIYLQGILIGFLMPFDYPPVKAFFLIFFTLLLTQYAFGGFAQSWANPVAICIIVLYLFFGEKFPNYLVNVSHLQRTGSFFKLLDDGLITKFSFDSSITGFLNMKVFEHAGINLPEGYVSIFLDNGSPIPAFRFNFLTLFSTLVLISLNLLDWVIPLISITVYIILVRVFGLFPYGGLLGQGDMLLAIFTGGTLFCTFFLLSWPGTTPLSIPGKLIYALITGIFAFLINGCGTSCFGAFFIILAANIISPIIQYLEDCIYLSFKLKRLEIKQ